MFTEALEEKLINIQNFPQAQPVLHLKSSIQLCEQMATLRIA
jgi:hypothetical protein